MENLRSVASAPANFGPSGPVGGDLLPQETKWNLPTEMLGGNAWSTDTPKTLKHEVSLIEAPSHIKEMTRARVSGAGVAIVFVSASQDFDFTQSSEQARLAFTLGIRQIIVAIRMKHANRSSSSWYQFELIKTEIERFLTTKIGFHPEQVAIVPISDWWGFNLFEPNPNFSWLRGFSAGPRIGCQTLMQSFESIRPPPRKEQDRPLRIPLRDAFHIDGVGTVATGRVATGTIRPGMVVSFAPINLSADVNSVERQHLQWDENGGVPGDDVGFNVVNVSARELCRGYVAGDSNHDPPRQTEEFIAQVVVMHNYTGRMRENYTPMVDCHTAHIACRFTEIIAKVDRRTGNTLEDHPESIEANQSALVRMVPTRPMCVETYEEFPALGHLIVQDDMGETVAVGIIKWVSKRLDGQAQTQTQTQGLVDASLCP